MVVAEDGLGVLSTSCQTREAPDYSAKLMVNSAWFLFSQCRDA